MVAKAPIIYPKKMFDKTLLSCLEIGISTGRFRGLPFEDRACYLSQYCMEHKLVETESHFLLTYPALSALKIDWLNKLQLPSDFNFYTDAEKLKVIFNNADYIKPTAQFIKDAFDHRSKLSYY